MKLINKLFTILILMFIICGCESQKLWKNSFEISELKIKNGYYIGKLKNKTKTKCISPTIQIEIKSGNLNENDYIFVHQNINPDEIIDIKENCFSNKNYEDLDDISIKVIDIHC